MVDVTVEVEQDEFGVPEAEQQAQPPNDPVSLGEEVQLFVIQYGWVILLVTVLTFLAYKKFKSHFEAMESTEDAKSSSDLMSEADHRQAMLAARERFQQQHDAQAAVYAAKMKEKEAAKRKEKVDEWEKHRLGGGYHSKCKPKETEEPEASLPKNKGKSKVRNEDYNPLMGSSGPSYRPGRSCNTGG